MIFQRSESGELCCRILPSFLRRAMIRGLSSVGTDQQRIGYEAATLLDRTMSGREPPGKPILAEPRQVVVRQSSETLAVTAPEVPGR